MSTNPKFSIPPISRDGFSFSGSEFYVEIEHHRYPRCDAATLYRYLTTPPTTDTPPAPLLTKAGKVAKQQPKPHLDPPVQFYRAQLTHYGLKPLKTKEPAKKALLAAFASHSGSSSIANALGTGNLVVPDKIKKLEEELREEYRVALAQAEKKYKAEKRKEKREKDKNEKMLAIIKDKSKALKNIADWVDESGRPKPSLPSTTQGQRETPIHVDNDAMDVDMDNVNSGLQQKLLSNVNPTTTDATTPQPVPNVFQNMPSVTFSVPGFEPHIPGRKGSRTKQTARKSTGGRAPRKSLNAASAKKIGLQAKARKKSVLAKARANTRATGGQPMSDWSLVELEEGLKEIPPSRLHAVIAKFMKTSPAFADEIRHEIGKQLGADAPESSPSTHQQIMAYDIQGVYEVSVPTILREWPEMCGDGMALSVCLSSTSSHLWCSFDFGMYEGIMRSISEDHPQPLPTSTEPNRTFRFQWRARDASENMIHYSLDQTCEIVFLPDGRIRGKMFRLYGEEREMFGRRIQGDAVDVDEVNEWKEEWREMNEAQYEVENRRRWGQPAADACPDGPAPSDTSDSDDDDDDDNEESDVYEYRL